MQRRLVQNFTYIMEWGQGTCTLMKRTRHWTYSALQHFSHWGYIFKMLKGGSNLLISEIAHMNFCLVDSTKYSIPTVARQIPEG